MTYLTAIILSVLVSALATLGVIRLASWLKILDQPGTHPKKIHKLPVPLLGGLGIALSFFAVLLYYLSSSDVIQQALHQANGVVLPKHLWGIGLATLVIMIGGILDDKFDLKPAWQLIAPITAVVIVIISGVGITFVTNPLGGLIYLDTWKTTVFHLAGWPYRIVWLADIFTFIWLMIMMHTTKLLDGLDGLVTGITALASLIIFVLSLEIKQPFTALMAAILFGANVGFLIFNFHPARIFLGWGGSVWAGLMIGWLSIVSGGKVATAMLVLGIPLLDLIWVAVRRVLIEKKSFAIGDKKHIHHRLLGVGLSHRSAVLVLYLITAGFGISALFLQSFGKLMALLALAVTMVCLGTFLFLANKQNLQKQKI